MATLEDFRLVVPIRVRFRDTDGMGHTNNAVFFTYYEEARAAYFRQVLDLRSYQDVAIILARATCEFRSPAFAGEELRLGVRVDRIGGKSFDMSYRAEEASSGRLVSEGTSVVVAYDYEAGRSVEVPDDFRRRVAEFEGRSF